MPHRARPPERPRARRGQAPRTSPDPASELHAELDRAVDDYYDGEISHDEFSRRQRETWDRIRRAGSATWDRVLERIRGELPPASLAAPARPAPSRSEVEREVRAVARSRPGSARRAR